MGKTRDFFKEIRDIKGPFCAKIGTIKDRNGDLTEAEDIKKMWQEYTEELFKKDLHDQDNHNCVITHLEAPDLASITSHIHIWVLFLLWLHPFILSGVFFSPLISSSILGT